MAVLRGQNVRPHPLGGDAVAKAASTHDEEAALGVFDGGAGETPRIGGKQHSLPIPSLYNAALLSREHAPRQRDLFQAAHAEAGGDKTARRPFTGVPSSRRAEASAQHSGC